MKLKYSWIIIFAVIAFLFTSCGNKSSQNTEMQMEQHHDMTTQQGDVKNAKKQTLNAPEAKIDDSVICPVMNTTIKVNDQTLFAMYKGKKYYVCCSYCLGELKKSPEKYIK